MSEQSVNGPEYLARRGWKPDVSGNWIDPAPGSNWLKNFYWLDAERRQKDRDAAALDRVLDLCGDEERLCRVLYGPTWDIAFSHAKEPVRTKAKRLAAEITRLVGGTGASAGSASGEEKNDA